MAYSCGYARLRVKKAAFRRKRSHPSQENDRLFSEARRSFKAAANSEYRSYLLGLVGDFRTNSKRFWSFLKSLKFSCHSPPTLTYEGHTFQSDIDKANCFNTCFTRKFSDPAAHCLSLVTPLLNLSPRRCVVSSFRAMLLSGSYSSWTHTKPAALTG